MYGVDQEVSGISFLGENLWRDGYDALKNRTYHAWIKVSGIDHNNTPKPRRTFATKALLLPISASI